MKNPSLTAISKFSGTLKTYVSKTAKVARRSATKACSILSFCNPNQIRFKIFRRFNASVGGATGDIGFTWITRLADDRDIALDFKCRTVLYKCACGADGPAERFRIANVKRSLINKHVVRKAIRTAETNGSGARFRDRRWATVVAGPLMLPPMLSPPCAAKVAAVPLTATLGLNVLDVSLPPLERMAPLALSVIGFPVTVYPVPSN